MSNLMHERLCEGKKQNTIIGAFKRLSKQTEELDTNDGNVSVKDISIVKAYDVVTNGLQARSVIDKVLDDASLNREKEATDKVIQHTAGREEPGASFNTAYENTKITDFEGGNIIENKKLVRGYEIEHETDNVSKADGMSKVDKIDKTDGVSQSRQLNENSSDQTKAAVKENDENLNAVKNTCLHENSMFVSDNIQMEKTVILDGSSQGKDTPNIYTPNVRKTRSGVKRTPVSQSKQRKRKGGKSKDAAVTYECPVCSLKVLCESLQVFNDHVDNCLENGANIKEDLNDNATVIKDLKQSDEFKKQSDEFEKENCKLEKQTDNSIEKSEVFESKDGVTKVYEDEVETKACENVECVLSGTEVGYTKLEKECSSSLETGKAGAGMEVKTSDIETVNKCEGIISLMTENQNNVSSALNTKHESTVNEESELNIISSKLVNKSININDDSVRPLSQDIYSANIMNRRDNKIHESETGHSSNDTEDVLEPSMELTACDTDEAVNETISETSDIHKDHDNTDMANNSVIDIGKVTVTNNSGNLSDKSEVNGVLNLDFPEHARLRIGGCDSGKTDNEFVNVKCSKVVTLSPKIIVESTDKGTKEKELVTPCTSTQSDERYHQMARSDAWVRKNLLDISDEIEKLTEDNITEDSADDEEQEGSLLVCPICNTEQRSADLNEFNGHVDMCLSRGAISEILREQKNSNNGSLKRSRVTTPASAKSAKRRKTSIPNISKSCRSIASFFQEK